MDESAVGYAFASFWSYFGGQPRWLASAPGRVNLIGEFTDYNDGFVLPMALERRTCIAAIPNGSDQVRISSEAAGESVTLDLDRPLPPEPRGRWANYVRGVLAAFMDRGARIPGFDAVIRSNVPIGAGLSSSAALEVAFATLLEGVSGQRLDPVAKALLCQQAEHAYAGVPCGIMDPFIATLGCEGRVLLLDCRSQQPLWLPLSDPAVTVLLINTNVKHQLATSAYAERRQECVAAAAALGVTSLRDATLELLEERADTMPQTIMRRARHVISETARTVQAAHCIHERDWCELGQLFDASHHSLQHDYAVSCAELDAVVTIARTIGREGGVYGCRMTGGGFGGCAVALIDTERQGAIMETIGRMYRERTGIEPTLFTSKPAAGARLIEV
jgi:galactokinase